MKNKIASFPRYQEYKDSGIEWLGEVPKDWEINRLDYYFINRRSKVSDKDFPPLSVTKKGIFPQLDTAAKTKDGDNRKLVKSGDFVINSRSDRKGSSGIANRDGSVSLINLVLKPKGVNIFFIEYLLKSYSFIEEYYRVGRGIVNDLWTTRYEEMRIITLSIPPLQEQSLIANFLDEKTSLIDKAIRIKEDQIEKLKEYKQALIQKAVTQGLNPNVPMKDSGVEWLGEIPEHWEIQKLKNKTRINRKVLDEKTNANIKIEYVDISSVSFENGIEKVDKYSFKNAPSRARRLVKEGDVIVSTVRTYLKAIAKIDKNSSKYIYSTGFAIVESLENLKPDFLYFFVKSNFFTDQVSIKSKGVSYPAINITDFLNIIIFLPSLQEQEEIANYLERKSQKIDQSLKIKEQEIEKLKEYKTRLIHSAVTGKIRLIAEK